VATAVKPRDEQKTAIQVAFTASGLQALGVPEHVIAGFSPEFLSGMAGEESRSRRLGDTGPSAPQKWAWGGPQQTPHVLAILLAKPGRLQAWQSEIRGGAFDAAFETPVCLPTSNLDGIEPFGFADGSSQPKIDWNRERVTGSDELAYVNLVALGEFLLGYPNEYGKYTARPLLDAAEEGSGLLLAAEDHPGKRDLGRNGTYLVIRQLDQDVHGFWQFLDRTAKSNAEERLRLAEAMVGRHIDGAPLVPLSSTAIPGIEDDPKQPANRFTYDGDPDGIRCPFGAHIRRANPRNVDLPGQPGWFLSRLLRTLGFGLKSFRVDLTASTRFHRILRRGREYGTEVKPDEAVKPKPSGDPERGLHFVCLNANISRQFEFVQNAWMMSAKFDGLSEESDPLMGNREAVNGCPYTGSFSIPQDGAPPRVLTGLPPFITVRGGAYFFLPSLRALGYIARTNHESRG
jgi:Dyp-type peroxidase family